MPFAICHVENALQLMQVTWRRVQRYLILCALKLFFYC